MRFALVAVALMAAVGPGWAQKIPDARDKETLRIYIDAVAAENYCLHMRINLPQLHAYLESRGFTEDNPQKRYPEFFEESMSFVADGVKTHRDFQCQYYFDELGDAGVHPHILVYR